MRLRQMAAAFLFNEDKEILFLQKKANSRFLGGHLVPVGGHIEDGEFGDPQRACLRADKKSVYNTYSWALSHLEAALLPVKKVSCCGRIPVSLTARV